MECNNCGENFAISKNIKQTPRYTTEKNIRTCPECGEEVEKDDEERSTTLLEKGI